MGLSGLRQRFMCVFIAGLAHRSGGRKPRQGRMTKSRSSMANTATAKRYFEQAGDMLGPVAQAKPVCPYLETTYRCNLPCTTCPRTFEYLEPPADMRCNLFTSILSPPP